VRDPAPAVRSSAIVLGPLEQDRRASNPSRLLDEGDLTAEPLIDEPVTSGGDASLWTGTPDDPDKGHGDEEKPK
jgi:hypothetical protein